MRKPLQFLWGIGVVCCLAFTQTIHAQTYKFAQLTGAPISTIGWNLQGSAYVGNTAANTPKGEIILTDPIRSQAGSIFFNTPINLAVCNKWITEFEFRIAEGNAADGLAFCYLEVPPVGFANGEGLGIPAAANGLKIAIDTYWNGFDPNNSCPSGVPKLQMRWGFGYKECNDAQPTVRNNNGELNFIRDGNFHKATINYNKGNITFAIDGKVYLSGFQTFNFTGYFGFTAGTGNSYDRHSIRNAIIYTDMPDSDAGNGATICSGATAQIGIPAPNPIYTYSWLPTTGLDNPKAYNPKVTLPNTGAFPVKQKYYMYTEFAAIPGCSSVDSVEVIVNPLPAVTVTTASNCFQDTMLITPKTGWPDSITNTMQWSWIYGDPASGANTSLGLTGRHKFSAPGNYVVVMNQTTREGCSQSTSQPVTVRALPPASFKAVNSGAVCINEPVKFVNRANAGTTGSTTVQPDNANNSIVFKFNKLFAVGDTVAINYRQAGVQEGKPFYVAKWSNTDAFGCIGTSFDTVIFRAQPAITMAAQGGVCLNVPAFNLNSATETSGLTGNGTYSGRGITSASGTFNPAVAGIGTHRISYVYQAQNGCVDTAIQNYSVYALPVVDAGPDKAILPGGYALLEGSSTIPPRTVVWTPGASLSNPNALRPEARPIADQLYFILVTTAQGCTGRDSVKVRALSGLTIPNAFSPHTNDAINDVWTIKNLDLFPGAIVSVFDRYGRQVYRSVGYSVPWDGRVNGVLVPVGVYYFIIDPLNGNKKYVGSITIL